MTKWWSRIEEKNGEKNQMRQEENEESVDGSLAIKKQWIRWEDPLHDKLGK